MNLNLSLIVAFNCLYNLSFCKIALRQLHWVSTDTAETGEYVIQDENRRNLLQSFIDNNTSPTIEEFGNLKVHPDIKTSLKYLKKNKTMYNGRRKHLFYLCGR